MPLVSIHLMQGKVGELVYQTMIEMINKPSKDNFQIITEHRKDNLMYDPEYLNIQRTDGIIIIQITLNEGRSVNLKEAFYKRLEKPLHNECT